MAFIPIPNTARIALEYTWQGQLVVNVYWASKTTPLVTADLTQIANIFLNWHANTLRGSQHTTVTLQQIEVIDQSAQNAPGVTLAANPATAAGTLAGNPVSNQVTGLTTFYTALRGRAYRGGVYHLGLIEEEVNANTMTLARVNAIVSAYGTLGTNLTAGGFAHTVGSRQLNNAPRVTGVATPVTAYAMNTRVDTQRRRLPGVGN